MTDKHRDRIFRVGVCCVLPAVLYLAGAAFSTGIRNYTAAYFLAGLTAFFAVMAVVIWRRIDRGL